MNMNLGKTTGLKQVKNRHSLKETVNRVCKRNIWFPQ